MTPSTMFLSFTTTHKSWFGRRRLLTSSRRSRSEQIGTSLWIICRSRIFLDCVPSVSKQVAKPSANRRTRAFLFFLFPLPFFLSLSPVPFHAGGEPIRFAWGVPVDFL